MKLSTTGPLAGVRVLEASTERPARIACMLLADLGAEVIRAVDPSTPPEALNPDVLCWDRGKRIRPLTARDVVAMAGRADVLVVDSGPSKLQARGWEQDVLRRRHPGLVHLWMPPYGEHGEWRDLPEDPLLLAALGGLAAFYPADDDSPIAPIAPSLTYLHGALGAAAAVAGLVGRSRQRAAQSAVVTGLHAAAALLGPAYMEFNGSPTNPGSRDLKGGPNWRLYRCADDHWIFLGALTPEIFFRALDALGRLDVMALPDVAGDFYSILDLQRGRPAVTAALEPVFASRDSAHWLARLQEARVPCAIAQPRAAWLNGPVMRDNEGRHDLLHPSLGPVTMPSVPLVFDDTPVAVRTFARHETSAEPFPWNERSYQVDASAAAALPLAGLRVVDSSTFQAGPMISTLLADFGADVVRVEPPAGDPYRTYALSFLAVNQRKRGVVLNLKQRDDIAKLHTLLNTADVYIENLRPHMMAKLDLAQDGIAPRFPQLVHCSVSAFGRAESFADLPGFDPILQTLSGMAVAQGGKDRPIVSPAPFNDATTGGLGALGSLAALYRRESGGRGQRMWISLAAAATYVQSGEFTTWPGAPAPQQGSLRFRGPDEGHRYYRCRDGWVAVAATDEAARTRMTAALGIEDLSDAERVLADQTVASATTLLCGDRVPCVRVVPYDFPLRDPFLVDNALTHTVAMPEGRARVVDRLSHWPGAPPPRTGRYFAPDEDAEEIFATFGAENVPIDSS